MGNSSGNYRVTLETHMANFDALPPQARKVMRNLSADYTCHELLREYKKGRAHGDRELVRLMSYDDVRQLMEAYRTYGPDHPQADNFGRRLKRSRNAIW